ncbi:hypothetical protein BJ170DRAFT_638028 [Xylariales sp. AK1849]|nr:hypothetical protein BJ170DRAFT_638028 [Xylariales sp. AK1849]
MDPISLTLGIIPLIGGAVKLYGAVHKKFRVFRHYSRELGRLRKRSDLERRFFLNETQLLLQTALKDTALVESMLEDPGHIRWQSDDLESSLQGLLTKSYDECQGIIQDICQAMDDLQGQLRCFDELETQRQKGESLKDTVCRLRNAAKIAWDKSKFETCIKELRDSNQDLRRLREQMCELQKPNTRTYSDKVLCSQLPPEYANFGIIKRASRAFHYALVNTWSKPTDDETIKLSHHDVRLFLDAKVVDGVCMDVAVVCYGHDGGSSLSTPSLARLQVRSQILDWVDSGLRTPPGATAISSSDESRLKRRKVRFADDSKDNPVSSRASTVLLKPINTTVMPPSLEDLSKRNFCSVISRRCLGFGDTCFTECLGYLDTSSNETFRHSFYKNVLISPQPPSPISIDEIMAQSAEKILTVVDQLKLARSLVAAVLKFHSTPWLASYMTLRDISFFKDHEDFAKCLQTLHFGAGFDPRGCTDLSSSSMDGLEPTCSPSSASMLTVIEDAKLQYGIRNMTLWSLGTILLQIGHWSRIEAPDDVVTVRKLSHQVSGLGQRYQMLTKRCLECDFGYGEDLSKPRLQQALYEKLLCELSSMINSLDISED